MDLSFSYFTALYMNFNGSPITHGMIQTYKLLPLTLVHYWK